MLPALMGLGVNQINILVDRWIASWLPEGSISYLYYANRLVQFPLGVFGIAIAVVILPVLSGHAARNEMDDLKNTLLFGIKLGMFIMIPASLGLIVLRWPLVNVLFQRGVFDKTATVATSSALLYYSIGLFAFAGAKITGTGLYSLQDTKTPFIISIYTLIINIILNLVLMGPMKHNGLALATSISAIFNFLALMLVIYKRLGAFGRLELVISSAKGLSASLLMAAVIGAIYLSLFSPASPLSARAGVLALCVVSGGAIYFAINRLWKSEEMNQLLKLVRRA
jgi:putative peptidoglycan lipid II flippase